jgi:hypothetical protein
MHVDRALLRPEAPRPWLFESNSTVTMREVSTCVLRANSAAPASTLVRKLTPVTSQIFL